MDKQRYDNTSLAAFRVFETLKCLINQPSDVNDIIEHLENLNTDENKAYSKAVIYKYLATLKFAGIDIEREKCRYKVTNLPFKINLDDDSKSALEIFNKILDFTPENKLVKELKFFLDSIKMRYSTDNINVRKIYEEISMQFANHKANDLQIKVLRKYEKYCKENLKLQIEYQDIFNEKISILCEPIEAKYEDSSVLLIVYNPNKSQFLELNSNQIIDIKQTPSSCQERQTYVTYSTVFTLKDRLAKRYTPRASEIRMDDGSNEDIRIFSNKEEPKENLYLRLMRYSDSCKLNSPKIDREIMKKLILKTLSNYEPYIKNKKLTS